MAIARYSWSPMPLRRTTPARPTTPAVATPVATASASRRACRRTSWRMARATGSATRTAMDRKRSVPRSSPGSRRLAATTSVSTPCVVALASRPAATSSAIPRHAAANRSRSPGRRIRRARWSSTTTGPAGTGPPPSGPAAGPASAGAAARGTAAGGGGGRGVRLGVVTSRSFHQDRMRRWHGTGSAPFPAGAEPDQAAPGNDGEHQGEHHHQAHVHQPDSRFVVPDRVGEPADRG